MTPATSGLIPPVVPECGTGRVLCGKQFISTAAISSAGTFFGIDFRYIIMIPQARPGPDTARESKTVTLTFNNNVVRRIVSKVMGRCFTGRLLAADRSCDWDKIAGRQSWRNAQLARARSRQRAVWQTDVEEVGMNQAIAPYQPPWPVNFIVDYSARLKIGAVSVLLLPSWREAELVWVLNKCQAKCSLHRRCLNKRVR